MYARRRDVGAGSEQGDDLAEALSGASTIGLDGAEALLREALRATARSVGASHSNHAAIGVSLADVLRTRGRLAEARALAGAALSTCERVFGREHPRTAAPLRALAEIDRAAGALPQARAGLERARAILDAAEVRPVERGYTLLDLARVVHAQGGEPERVRALVAEVRRLAEEAGQAGAALRADLAAWADAAPELAATLQDGEKDMSE